MEIYTDNYSYLNTPVTTKQTYIDKFDKSLKLPFKNVLNNHFANIKPVIADEAGKNDPELMIKDIVELNYAVIGASSVGDSATGSALDDHKR